MNMADEFDKDEKLPGTVSSDHSNYGQWDDMLDEADTGKLPEPEIEIDSDDRKLGDAWLMGAGSYIIVVLLVIFAMNFT